MCWCVGGQTANMAEKGMTASGYGTEYAWQIRTVSYRPVGDEVIPPNTKNTVDDSRVIREGKTGSILL